MNIPVITPIEESIMLPPFELSYDVALQLVEGHGPIALLSKGSFNYAIGDIPTIIVSQARLANMFPANEDPAHIWDMTLHEILRQAHAQADSTQFRLVAGEEIGLSFVQYCDIVQTLRQHFSTAKLATYSVDDIWLFASVYHLSIAEVLNHLQSVGMDSLADDRDRDLSHSHAPVLPDAAPADDWTKVIQEAAQHGIQGALVLHWQLVKDSITILQRVYQAHNIGQLFTECVIVANKTADHAQSAQVDRLARIVSLALPALPVSIRL